MGLEATSIPRCIKVQHIKGIANILADSVLRLRAVGIYHDLDFKDHQQELSIPFNPLPPVEQSTHTPIEVNEVFIAPDIENLMQNYDMLKTLLVIQAALRSASNPPRLWYRFVDDTWVIQQQAHKQLSLDHINSIDPTITFTVKGNQENGPIPFLIHWSNLRQTTPLA